ncbi:hypothetical protein ONZ51_g4568 [Trametes cubensis]|uniref:DUF6534 domain-containing protein n=1 Tax=Trametes cubensis TaxID=1111947 RepID=A0AAD7XA53_9APHY|nr:hypothetical protein ONZ51_g4568 [Trametes cubensis]
MNSSDVPSDSLPLLPQAPALDNTYGAGLIGTAVGLMLFGLTVHQVYRYFRLYPTDPRYIKIYVVVLLILETFHIVISLHTCYFYLITNYLQPGAFLVPIWSVNTVPLATGVVAVVSQCFFAHRVWLVGPQLRPLVLISVVFLLVELGFSMAATIETYVRPLYKSYWSVTWVFSASFGVAIVVDSVLTGTLITILHRSRTGIKRTDSMIDLLIVYSVNTGLLTGIFNILTFTFALVYPDNIIYGGFAIVTAKLYANSVLAALNARKSLIKADGLEMDSLGLSFAAGPTERATTITTADPRHTNTQLNSGVIDIIKPETLHTSTTRTDDDADDGQEAKAASLTAEVV